MTNLPGRWALTMRTPVGSIEAEMTFSQQDNAITGTAAGKAETVPITDVVVTPTTEGEHVTWNQSVTKPMRLNLAFDVQIHGDTMHGYSRAGRLPRSAVTGSRRAG